MPRSSGSTGSLGVVGKDAAGAVPTVYEGVARRIR